MDDSNFNNYKSTYNVNLKHSTMYRSNDQLNKCSTVKYDSKYESNTNNISNNLRLSALKAVKKTKDTLNEIENDDLGKELSNKGLLYVLKEGLSPRYGKLNNTTSSMDQQQQDPFYSSDEYYMLQLYNILNVSRSGILFNQSPAKVTDYMYIGGYRDAKNWQKLKEIGITHVLNLAAFWEDSSYNPYPKESSVVAYEAYNAQDNEDYNIMQHYPSVRPFIDRARWTGGKVLVHCAMGINRSGVMCCAYLMDGQKMLFFDAVRKLKQQRGTVLMNRGFQKQLLYFARENGSI